MKETVGFIGLGGMGLPMATNLLKAGFDLRVYNRTADKAKPLLEQGAMLARSPAEAVIPGGMVVTMVFDDRAVDEVTLGPGGSMPQNLWAASHRPHRGKFIEEQVVTGPA